VKLITTKPGVEIAFLMVKYLPFILILLCFNYIQAQEIAVGSWRMHISYQNASDVTLGIDKVYTASKNGVFIFDQKDNSIQTLTKLDGLSDADISKVGYSSENALLLVGYRNGNVDVVSDKSIINFPVIKNSSYEFKSINDFMFLNQTCFISTDFGVVVLDLSSLNVLDAYENIGVDGSTLKISQSVIYQDSLFLSSDNGVMSGWLDPSNNLKDFNNWKRFDAADNIPPDTATSITIFQGNVFSSINNDGIYKYTGTWSREPYLQGMGINSVSGNNQQMTISTTNKLYILNTDGQLEKVESNLIQSPKIALSDTKGLWIADGNSSLVSNFSGEFESITASGPISDRFAEIGYNNNMIIGLPGGYDTKRLPFLDSLGFSVFASGVWSTFNQPQDVATDLIGVAFKSDIIEMISFGDGTTQWKPGSDPISINSTSPDYPFNSNFLTSIFADDEELWVTTYATNPSIYLNDGSGWISVDPAVTGQDKILESLRDFDGNMWFRVDPLDLGGIIVYNHDTKNVNWLSTASGSGDLPSREVWDLELDLNGNIWVGTNKGVAYFPRGANPFGSIESIKPIFDGRFLLGDEVVTTLKTDGANRKWFGTENGAWLFGEFGESFLVHFTDEDPLLSNEVVKIQINDITGEIFFATTNGLSSFRGNATSGSPIHFNVKIFPNPVSPGYRGVVAIEGLPVDAEVKITDVAGNLIWQANSFGGTATWDLTTLYGTRPATGMYMIYSSTADGKDTFVGKLAIIN